MEKIFRGKITEDGRTIAHFVAEGEFIVVTTERRSAMIFNSRADYFDWLESNDFEVATCKEAQYAPEDDLYNVI